MLHAKIYSATTLGLEVKLIEVEVNIESQGFPAFNIVGLADKSIDESKERVRASIKNLGLEFPDRRITVNLAPAEFHKKGTNFDLAIVVGILVASEQIKGDFSECLFLGELSHDGRLRRVNGVLPITLLAKQKGLKTNFIPDDCKGEAAVVSEIKVIPVANLGEYVLHLIGEKTIEPVKSVDIASLLNSLVSYELDMEEVVGQEKAKRALEICAAGGHNLAMGGPPGSGKTMLARAFPSILPNLTLHECLEVTKIYSVCGFLSAQGKQLMTTRPFRSPHHTTSLVGLIGGGSAPAPGEITLSHRGVLFLDEFTELPRNLIEALRQPLEDGFITISRSHGKLTFPARFILILSFNPCPCGYFGDEKMRCKCTAYQIISYQKKLSGPVMDRIDLFVDVKSVNAEELSSSSKREPSIKIRQRVEVARMIQSERFKDSAASGVICNADMNSKLIKKFCALDSEKLNFMKKAMINYRLSLRGFNRVLKVARTIADLAGSNDLNISHLAEALQFRIKENG